jgi:gas vesicle protein
MKNHTDKHETKTDNSPGSFLTGVFLGSLVGAGVMLLLAPQSGQTTRTKIQLRSMELGEQATDAIENQIDQTRLKAHKIKSDLQSKVKEIQNNTQNLYDEQTNRLRHARADALYEEQKRQVASLSAEKAGNHV